MDSIILADSIGYDFKSKTDLANVSFGPDTNTRYFMEMYTVIMLKRPHYTLMPGQLT